MGISGVCCSSNTGVAVGRIVVDWVSLLWIVWSVWTSCASDTIGSVVGTIDSGTVLSGTGWTTEDSEVSIPIEKIENPGVSVENLS